MKRLEDRKESRLDRLRKTARPSDPYIQGEVYEVNQHRQPPVQRVAKPERKVKKAKKGLKKKKQFHIEKVSSNKIHKAIDVKN